jgi:hypothetical protein
LASKHWRRASVANFGERISGTHIVTGRMPFARKRARWVRTFSRDVKGFDFLVLVFRCVVLDVMTRAFGYM